MQKIILKNDMTKYQAQIEQPVIDHVCEGLIETYESFENYSMIGFDWIDPTDVDGFSTKVLVYIDKDDLFVICEDEAALERMQLFFTEAPTNEKALYTFFKSIIRGADKNIDSIEDRISEIDDEVMKKISDELREEIVDIRYNLLQLKKYYEQLDSIFEEICEEDNEVISDEYLRYFGILNNRSSKLLSEIATLREFITQVRESYQAQIDIEQNRMMKVFTLVTSIFLPLTLIAGWYGMNFVNMPELTSKYGYLGVILVSILVVIVWYIVFKKKGWFKG